jgi:bifunctional non-homologous end joining protein LigD
MSMIAPSSICRTPKSSRWGGGVTADEMREMQWVTPELVAQVRFVEWTAEGRLRHAAFLGLRPDKTAREVRREWPGLSGG